MKNIIKRILREQNELEKLKMIVDSNNFQLAIALSEAVGLEKPVMELILNKILLKFKNMTKGFFFYPFSSETYEFIENIKEIEVHEIEKDDDDKKVYITVELEEDKNMPYNEIFTDIEDEFYNESGDKIKILMGIPM